MIITLKDGSKKEYAQAMSIIDIARDISEGLARVACVGEVDGQTEDLRTVIDKDCELNILHRLSRDCIRAQSLRSVRLLPTDSIMISISRPRSQQTIWKKSRLR